MQHSSFHSRLAATTIALPLSIGLCQPLAAQQLTDPTRPYTGSSSNLNRTPDKPRQAQLQAIYSFNGQRLAIIDGTLVHEGDQLASLRIDKIADDHVRYVRNGVIGLLLLHPTPSSVQISSTRLQDTP
ncbi:MAG: hypothetical protein AB7F79_03805 [Steroidobacteraceae bacterium]